MNESYLTMTLEHFSPNLKGAMFMLMWAISFSSALAIAKSLSPEVDNIIILFLRYLFGFIFFSPFIFKERHKGFVTARPFLQLLRVACVIAAMGCTYYAYRHLPLALATSIGMTGPLFTTLLSILILKDAVSFQKWAFIFFGYLGVIVMVQPHETSISIGVWVELFANLFAALVIVFTKILSRTDSTVTIMLYTTTATAFLSAALVPFVWETPAVYDFIALMAIGAFGVSSQYCYISALRFANPSYLAPFEYTRLCFAVPVGYFFFGEVPTFLTILGSFMIIGATYGLTRFEDVIRTLK